MGIRPRRLIAAVSLVSIVASGLLAVASPATATASATMDPTTQPTSIVLSSITSPMQAFSAGTVTATVVPGSSGDGRTPTGSIGFTIFGPGSSGPLIKVPLDDQGQATLDISSIDPGTYTIAPFYYGDTYYSSSAIYPGPSLTVTGLPVEMTVQPDHSTTPVDAGVHYLVTVRDAAGTGHGAPYGTVQLFADDGTALSSGTLDAADDDSSTVTLVDASLPVGTHSVYAEYFGFRVYTSGSSPAISETVTPEPTTLAVQPFGNAGDSDTFYLGSDESLYVRLDAPGSSHPVATGQITLSVNGKPLPEPSPLNGSSGTTLDLGVLPLGTYQVDAHYAGDTNWSAADGTFTVSVIRQPVLVLLNSPTLIKVGDHLALTASVDPFLSNGPVPTGAVSFYNDGSLLGSAELDPTGQATFAASD